jgi:Tol biopolymer transport system component
MSQQLFKRFSFILLIGLAAVFAVSAQPVVKAELDAEVYSLGDLVTLDIEVSQNPGFQSLFFDLEYDDSVLQVVSVQKGFMAERESEENEFLYAVSDPNTSTTHGSHIVLAYSLTDKTNTTQENGKLARITFRIIDSGTPELAYSFTFDDHDMRDMSNTSIPDVQWIDSLDFYISTEMTDATVEIVTPAFNQVLYKNIADIQAVVSYGAGRYVEISNLETEYNSPAILTETVEQGQPSGLVSLVSGANKLAVTLFDTLGNKLAMDTVTVFYSDQTGFVEIIDPVDHAFLNNNYILVTIASAYDSVTLNGQQTEALGTSDGSGRKEYAAGIWLKKGFNELTAKVVGPESEIYEHSIDVFYEPGDEAFSIVSPYDGEIIKSGNDASIFLLGEISEKNNLDGTKNTVHLDAIYHPFNPGQESRYILKNQVADIIESGSTAAIVSTPYVFMLPDGIDVSGFESGKLEIRAYKNRVGSKSDAVVTRFVSLNSEELKISIYQPNIYGNDILNSRAKIESIGEWVSNSSIEMDVNGSFVLARDSLLIENIAPFNPGGSNDYFIQKVIEAPNGDAYAVGRDSSETSLLFIKPVGTTSWELLDTFSDIFAYDIAVTPLGLLVGASNKYQTGNTGLYLYSEGELRNIKIGKPINHVQFIENKNGSIYLYGNNYMYLYEFSAYAIETVNGKLVVENVNEIPFNNNFFINQFILSDDLQSAIILEEGKVHFFQQNTVKGYVEKRLDVSFLLDEDRPEDYYISRVFLAENGESAYRTYAFIDNTGSKLYSLMEDKKTGRHLLKLISNVLDRDNFSLRAIGERNERFVLVYENVDTNDFEISEGVLLFSQWSEISKDVFVNSTNKTVTFNDFQIDTLPSGSVYAGIGDTLGYDTDVYSFRNVYPGTGTLQFNYNNPDALAVNGFSFDVHRKWIDRDGIQFAFNVYSGENDEVELSHGTVSDNALMGYVEGSKLFDLLSVEENVGFSVSKIYLSTLESYQVTVTFDEPVENARINMGIGFVSNGESAPAVDNFTVFKKGLIRYPKDPDSAENFVPISVQGRVNDPSVSGIRIDAVDKIEGNVFVPVAPDGSFSATLFLKKAQEVHTIEVEAQNSAGEIAQEEFEIRLFDSVNALEILQITDVSSEVLGFDSEGTIVSETEFILLTGSYFGLSGAKVGYEIYRNGDFIEGGILETEPNADVFTGEGYEEIADLVNGYDRGIFTAEAIKLYPGEQELRIYVENPGGKRSYFINPSTGENSINANYQLPSKMQKIYFENFDIITLDVDKIDPDIEDSYVFDGVDIEAGLYMDISELKEWSSAQEKNIYVYKDSYEIEGRVRSLYNLSELKVRSSQSYVRFENGLQDTTIEVQDDGSFSVRIYIVLPENTPKETFDGVSHITFTPSAPFLDWMKTGLVLRVKKDYTNSFIVPDFSEMQGWTDDEKKDSSKPFRLRILEDRFIPEGMSISFIVNYTEQLEGGMLVETMPGSSIYRVEMDSEEVNLEGVKFGMNRVAWKIFHEGKLVSASTFPQPEMQDGLIYINNDVIYSPTTVSFASPLQMATYYDKFDGLGTELPLLNITKDALTKVEILLNGGVVDIDQTQTIVDPIQLYESEYIAQGINRVSISWTNKAGEAGRAEYSFVFDSEDPKINSPSVTYDAEFTKVMGIDVLVQEKNISLITIQYVPVGQTGYATYNATPVLSQKGEDLFLASFDFTDIPVDLIWTKDGGQTINNIILTVYDHSGRDKDFVIDENPSSEVVRPSEPDVSPIEVGTEYYQIGQNYFHSDTFTVNPFDHVKYYSDDIQIIDRNYEGYQTGVEPYKIERPGVITLGADPENDTVVTPVTVGNTTAGHLVVNSSEGVVLKPGFSVSQGSTFSVNIVEDGGPEPAPVLEFQRSYPLGESAPNSFSVIFQMRYEHEAPYSPEDPSVYRKVLTLMDSDDGEKGTEIFLGYLDLSRDVLGDEKLYILQQNRNKVADVWEYDAIEEVTPGDQTLSSVPDEWIWVNVGVDSTNRRWSIQVGSQPEESGNIFDEDNEYKVYDTVFGYQPLSGDAVLPEPYYFGDKDSDQNGHFSIANAHYTSTKMDTVEAAPSMQLVGEGGTSELPARVYGFDDPTSNIVLSDQPGFQSSDPDYRYYDLRIHADPNEVTNFFIDNENSDFSQSSDGADGPKFGSLKATNEHRNLIEAGSDFLKLAASDKVFLSNIKTVIQSPNAIQFEPDNKNDYAEYYFSDNQRSHGISTSYANYSIQGTVEELFYTVSGEQVLIPLDAELVVNFVGVRGTVSNVSETHTFQLEYGDFHFVLNNSIDEIVKVLFYIKTKSKIKISKDLVFTEGNYRIPDQYNGSIGKSYATTSYTFGPNGTISLAYKPINHNEDGLVNETVTILDSDYVKIFTKKGPEDGIARFSAEISGENGKVTLDSEVIVKQGWQDIHITFAKSANINESAAYLYIDGKLAAMKEGINLPLAPTSTGGDNIVIGKDISAEKYAEGYIDEFVTLTTFKRPSSNNTPPIEFTYIEHETEIDHKILKRTSDLSVTINLPGAEFDDISYTLYSIWENSKQTYNTESVTDFGFDISKLDPGNYVLKAEMTINDHNFNTTYSFVKDTEPRFTVVNATPIIIEKVESTIKFDVRFDNGFLSEDVEMKKTGFVLRISGQKSESLNDDFDRYFYGRKRIDENMIVVWEYWDQVEDEWLPLDASGEVFKIEFPNVISISDIDWELRSFYYITMVTTASEIEKIPVVEEGVIPEAYLTPHVESVGDELDRTNYMLKVLVGSDNEGLIENDILNQISLGYVVESRDGSYPINNSPSNEVPIPFDRTVELYFDDILPGFGDFDITVFIKYDGQSYGETVVPNVVWEEITTEVNYGSVKQLSIVDFALLHMDKDTGEASAYLEINKKGLNAIKYQVTVFDESGNNTWNSTEVVLDDGVNSTIIHGISVEPGHNLVEVIVSASDFDFDRTKTFDISLVAEAPELILTNTVESYLKYNNVYFSWIGKPGKGNDAAIGYEYQIDNGGWTGSNPNVKTAEFFNLPDGEHEFMVRAVQDGQYSYIRAVKFFVDVTPVEFDTNGISINEYRDEDGILYAIDLRGEPGTIIDEALQYVTVNGELALFEDDGSFEFDNLTIDIDGDTKIMLGAYDIVGNYSEVELTLTNNLTHLFYPNSDGPQGSIIKYAPMVLVGVVDTAIKGDIDIYLRDPSNSSALELKDLKKATINEDKVFFIEDVYINPGNSGKAAMTELELITVTESGHEYRKVISLLANDLIRPIDLELSQHTATGQTTATEIEITAKAEIHNIASWSIDFDGDGIYDMIEVVDDPSLAKSKTWTHKYSSLGLVKPRVRIITRDGQYFSVHDELIIHERIKEASHKIIDNPIAMAVEEREDNSERLYVLAGISGGFRMEVFEIGRNETYISNKLYTVDLEGLTDEDPSEIAVGDEDNIYIGRNRAGKGYIDWLQANEYGNYAVAKTVELASELKDITLQSGAMLVSLIGMNDIAKIPLDGFEPMSTDLSYESVKVLYDVPLQAGSSIAGDPMGLLIADPANRRLLRVSEGFKALEKFGSFGEGEAQFIEPSLLSSKGERIFVYDSRREDIQIFDPFFSIQTSLRYDSDAESNYFSETFLSDVADISAVSKEEGNDLYYYVLVLSKADNKLAMIRLPLWQEMRARVRNNKIVFLKDREVFTAKPDGSDLAKIISTDSIPRIEGTIDYPNLSPDGRKMVFTSRVELYDGNGEYLEGGNQHAYDNLYIMDVDGENLQRISLGAIQHFEIERPVFSSNGTNIAFSAKESGSNWQLYLYNIEDGSIARLFESDENVRFPYFSPDDKYIVFTTDYDGDEEIEFVEVENTSIRVSVTSNNARDSFPVWSTVYPTEIADTSLNITGKIGFVSERNLHKGVHYAYISQPNASEILVVNKDGTGFGTEPDDAAVEITTEEIEGDYPSYTGDGQSVVYEYFDGELDQLRIYDFETQSDDVMNLPSGIRRPAGMKNMIANFTAVPVNGDEVQLSWSPYTDNEIFYTVFYKVRSSGDNFTVKKVYSQEGTRLKGLVMGQEYLFRVAIIENDEEVASTQYKPVLMPEVAARPSFSIDEDNPYLIHLHAWTPETNEWNQGNETNWYFSWLIDNREIQVQTSTEFLYEFGTSGRKTIVLKAANQGNTYTAYSEPMFVDIVSDIVPVVEHTMSSNGNYLTLSASNSRGTKIDMSSAVWTISGPGALPFQTVGSDVIIDVQAQGFKHKVNVNLSLKRIPVADQPATDTIVVNKLIDLSYTEIKPVITYNADEANEQLLNFTGEHSLGNVDWFSAQWAVQDDGQTIFQQNGVSSFAYTFPESGREKPYTVVLTVPNADRSGSVTATAIISLAAKTIEPVIDYEIVDLVEIEMVDGEPVEVVKGAKVILSAASSKGSSIDFNSAKWTVPVAGTYGEPATQIGPTAVYNLFSIENEAVIEVSLTLSRRGGGDPVTSTQAVRIAPDTAMASVIKPNFEMVETEIGTILYMDVLSSTGPNIDWAKTEWLIDGQYTRNGASVRYDVPAVGDDRVVSYQVTLHRYGMEPQIMRDTISVDARVIKPFIDVRTVNEIKGLESVSTGSNLVELSVVNTAAPNIDWERTKWYIYDLSGNVIEKYGATVSHAFALSEEPFNYPVAVEMFFKGSTKPFAAYKNVSVVADVFDVNFTWDKNMKENGNVIRFDASSSFGNNIDWSSAKWTFGDGSEAQYGASAIHEYRPNGTDTFYTVSLTLVRRSGTGYSETKTFTKIIDIDADKITPVISATKMGYTVVFSAKNSEGRGLLLDRSVWLFDGAGDSSSISNNTTFSAGVAVSVQTNWGTKWFGGGLGFEASTNLSNSSGQGSSNQNTHVGIVCRRSFSTYGWGYSLYDSSIVVSLTVYRLESDGTLRSETIKSSFTYDQIPEQNSQSTNSQ